MRKPSTVKAAIAAAVVVMAALTARLVTAAEDSREFVELPAMMQEHMLANMRDHLVTLDEILAALAKDDAGTAAQAAENRLGMSSLSLHGAEHMAPFMPEEMAKIGTQMHRAASQFAIIVRDAELDPPGESKRKAYDALQAITQNWVACHDAYRIR